MLTKKNWIYFFPSQVFNQNGVSHEANLRTSTFICFIQLHHLSLNNNPYFKNKKKYSIFTRMLRLDLLQFIAQLQFKNSLYPASVPSKWLLKITSAWFFEMYLCHKSFNSVGESDCIRTEKYLKFSSLYANVEVKKWS